MSTNNFSAAENAVFDAIHKVLHRYRAAVAHELRDSGQALTHMEHRALGFFARMPGATLSDLVAHSGRDKAQLARLVRDLREKALLEATIDAHDRRVTRLSLSPAGQTLHEAMQARQHAIQARAVADFSPAECAQLAGLLEKILVNLENGAVPERPVTPA